MSEQIAVRIPDELSEQLDQLVEWFGFESKAEAVRAAIRNLAEAERRRRVGAAIVDGYRRMPQDDDDVKASRAAAIRSIEEEPW